MGCSHKSLLLTNIFHCETVFFVEIGDVVLAAKLHTVGGPNGRVVCVKEALPVQMVVLRTFLPCTTGRSERLWGKRKKKRYCEAKVKVHYMLSVDF